MEDGNFAVAKNDKIVSTSLENLYCDHPAKFTSNGHDVKSEAVGVAAAQQTFEATPEDAFKKRVNPLKIHLGKRPFVDNSPQFHSSTKKKAPTLNKHLELTASPNNTVPRAPRLIPKKKINSNLFHNVTSQVHSYLAENEQDKPVPRLVPKSQLEQFKKSAAERAQTSEGAQTAGLQPTVKFKCRKCCSMSFKTLAMLKEHQLVCRGQTKEPAHSPETAPLGEANSSGPSRVTKKVYLCSACGTYYENWNLFLHMREVHNRHICLFCLGMFSKAEKLAAHLTNKHNVQEHTYDTKEDFLNVYNGTLYLMCCECDEICSEQDDFFNHDCNNVKPVPVPVLVSKNSVKMNNLKQIKNHSDLNNPVSKVKETKSICDSTKDRRHLSEPKPETVTTLPSTVTSQSSECEPISCETNVRLLSAAESNRDTSEKSNLNRIGSSNNKPVPGPDQHAASDSKDDKDLLPNGEDDMDYSVDSDTPEAMDTNHSADETPVKYQPCPPPEKGNCGIKLKLSLNKANSPVIINSTVDPTVGLHSASKPRSRSRRPSKRYDKPTPSPDPVNALPKTPTIKMTISQSDSPYVKTTIYENNEETLLKSLLNNNLDTAASKSLAQKPDNTILSTIYDNSLEDSLNTLNRVPKLTVKIPKELLDKDSSSEYSSDSDLSDKLTMDENTTIEEPNKIIDKTKPEIQPETQQIYDASLRQDNTNNEIVIPKQEEAQPDEIKPLDDTTSDPMETQIDVEKVPDEPVVEEIPAIELKLDKPLDKYPIKELLKLFLATTIYNCIYCNHVRKIAVNCEQLSLHMASEHRFCATVDSITAEELLPETITTKVKADAEELRTIYINFDSYDSEDNSANKQMIDFLFECFQCFFKTPVHKDLYLHNRKMHHKTILFCVMCKSNFYSYSELICHLCPGAYDSDYEVKFRCCFCNLDSIPSSFRLMVHLRKSHSTCDVCLELCFSQAKLSNHVWKHKLHHFCYRCGITYRNKQDITKHLFWKHGTESVLCKRCLQKKWPHVYHFCSPPAVFACEECNLQFTRAVYLKVHKRFHLQEFPHPCIEEGCTEKFVSKKLLMKHLEEHQRKLATIDLEAKTDKNVAPANILGDAPKEPIPIIDLVDDKPAEQTTASTEVKTEAGTEQLSKKAKKKKLKDALLLDVNLPELNLSESDSSDESDSGMSQPAKDEKVEVKTDKEDEEPVKLEAKPDPVATGKTEVKPIPDKLQEDVKVEEKAEPIEEKPDEQQVLDIWDNFQKYQAKTEKQKTPPLVPIKKHVCESDHDYCLIPTNLNGDDDPFNLDKKKNKKKDKKRGEFSSSSSSSSSDSNSSCSCGSNCSCSSSSGSSSSSSSDSDSSDEPNRIKKKKQRVKTLSHRRMSNGSNVDVMGMSETPILIPEKTEPPIPETDLETAESETDEEFYDEHPQRLANQLFAEKRNQLMLLASVAPSDGGSMSGEASRPATPKLSEKKEKMSSSKKKSKKKKRSKSSRKHEPIKINIPKDFISTTVPETPPPPIPNKIKISLQSNTVQMPQIQEYPITPVSAIPQTSTPASSDASKRASKRRRVPNKFYGYSSDEEGGPSVTTPQHLPLKPQLPPKLEWRKEDLPSPVTHRPKKEVPTSTASPKIYNYPEPIRLKAPPRPEPEPPKNLMNTESMDSSDSDSSDDGALEIYQPSAYSTPTLPPPTYLNSGTSSLPYAFQRPAGRQAREGESVYCYCRCPYDEVSEMIACDADGCAIEWFHFECVGIMVPPKGKWYCPECRKKACFSGYRS